MRYLGSKTSLLDKIECLVEDFSKTGIFCDPFGGIGTVGTAMKKKGYQIITGDILYFAHCFQVALIENNDDISFAKLRKNIFSDFVGDIEEYLNSLIGQDGWLVEEYAKKRKFFTEENAMKIQACMDCIRRWNQLHILEENEYEILVASLIQSFDKVANTAGTYYAYLKDYYRKSKQPFYFRLIRAYKSKLECKSYLMEANELIQKCKYDILYLDPPYNERNYRRYYHLPENIALGIEPIPKGKSGIYTVETQDSLYNRKKTATTAFEKLIRDARAGCIIFHYTDDGLIDMGDARDILKGKGKLDEFYFDSKGYTTVSNTGNCRHHILRVIG